MSEPQVQPVNAAKTFTARTHLLTPVSHDGPLTRNDIAGFLNQRLLSGDEDEERVELTPRLS